MDKFVVNIKSTSDDAAPHGSFDAVLSVPTLDRDQEVIDAKAFEPLPDHITIDVDHQMSVEKTIGSGTPYYDGDVLKFKGTYASHPLAQMVRGLVDEGHIRTMSVAFMGAAYEVDKKDGRRHLRKGELLNAGIVGIPSNRDALITASKSLVADVLAAEPDEVEIKAGARHSTADTHLLQTAHDALAALGVVCETKSPEASDESPTEADAKAATAAAPEAPAVPAAVNVEVVQAKARALAAEAALALL